MRWLAYVRLRVRAWIWPVRVAEEIADELRFHVEMETYELVGAGWPVAEARAEARRRFGDFGRIHDRCRRMYLVTRDGRGDMLGQDLRLAWRSLRKNPGFAAVAVLTLALGIGGNTAIFTLVNGVVLRPLPYDRAEQLVSLWHRYESVGLLRASVSPPNFRDYTGETDVFQSLAAFVDENYTVTGGDRPFRLTGMRVTPSFFDVFGVRAAHGRLFRPEEAVPGADRVAVVSHAAWRNRWGGDEALIGRSVVLDGQSYLVVGILPATFDVVESPGVYMPLAFTPDDLSDARRGREYLTVVGRLQDDVDLSTARSRMAEVAARIDREYDRQGYEIVMASLQEDIVGGDTGPALYMLLGAVGLVLLIGCVNVANLLYAKAESRQREVALCTALGASRGRVVRQFLTESVLIGGLGGAAGLALAVWGVKVVTAMPNLDIPRVSEVSLDVRVLIFTLIVSLGTGLLFGMGPAWGVARGTPLGVLHEGGQRAIGGRRGMRVRRALVVAEVSLALMLLVGAGLLLKSFARLAVVDPGFEPDGVLSMRVDLARSRYPVGAQQWQFYQQALDRIRSLPGVREVGAITPTPMSGANWNGTFYVEGVTYDDDTPPPNTSQRFVSPRYFSTIGIPLRAGRTFDLSDTPTNLSVVVVDETFVRRYLPGRDPVGQRIGDPREWSTIVGVVGDVQDTRLGGDVNGHIYWPYSQRPVRFAGVVIRTAGDPSDIANAAIAAVQEIDPTLAPFDVQPMQDRVRATIAGPQFVSALLAIFALVALLLAAIGIYGVLAYAVSQRTNEIGVRTALGASSPDVLRLVVWQGFSPALMGLGLGLLGSFGASRFLESQLFGVSATDPAVFATVSLVLCAVAFLACYLPARRATRVSPMTALRM